MTNPLKVVYNDLIKEQERVLAWMKRDYPIRVAAGDLSAWTAQHRIAVTQQLLRLLKRHKKVQQTNLEDMFKALPQAKVAMRMPAAAPITDPDFYTSPE